MQVSARISPDAAAAGLIATPPSALRYGNAATLDPLEVPGLMHRLLPDHARVLDIGTGAGAATVAINSGKSNTVVCVEPDAARAAAARARGLDVREAYFDAALARELGLFDAVMMGDVLEHLSDPASVLRDLKTCLKPGGFIVASVPNVAHWTIRAKLALGRFDYAESGLMDATHLRWFTRRTFTELIASQGYAIDWCGATAGAWLPVYNSPPGRWLHPGVRRRLLALGLKLWPGGVACQHVVRARLA